MKFQMWVVAAAFLASAAGFAASDCANADGSIVYHAWQYEGGAGPPPGMHVGHSEVVYKGEVIAKADYYSGGRFEQLPIQIEEVAGSRVQVENHSGNASVDTTYVHKVNLTREDGGAVLPDNDSKKLTVILLCHDVQHFYP